MTDPRVYVVVYAPEALLPDFPPPLFQALFGLKSGITIAPGDSRWAAYNGAIKAAIEGDFTHILFLAATARPPRKAAQYLLERAADVVAGVTFHPRPPHSPKAWMRNPDDTLSSVPPQREGLLEVDAVAADCLLVSVEALKRAPGPWFVETFNPDGSLHEGAEGHFSRLLKGSGAKVLADFDVPCQTAVITYITAEDSLRDWDRWKKLTS